VGIRVTTGSATNPQIREVLRDYSFRSTVNDDAQLREFALSFLRHNMEFEDREIAVLAESVFSAALIALVMLRRHDAESALDPNERTRCQ
jgi:hypothetical protein